MIANPWPDLPEAAPYLLASDAQEINKFNVSATEEVRVQLQLLPEPFLGMPDAPVVLLNLNPGFSDGDLAAHRDAQFRSCVTAALRHLDQPYPFYYLDPKGESPGHRWWRKRLKPVLEYVSSKIAASRLLCVEFFPYHSRKFGHRKLRLPSQMYGFELVRSAIKRSATIVLLRGEQPWLSAVPGLIDYARLFRLNSNQNVTLSPRNCPEGFDHVLAALSD